MLLYIHSTVVPFVGVMIKEYEQSKRREGLTRVGNNSQGGDSGEEEEEDDGDLADGLPSYLLPESDSEDDTPLAVLDGSIPSNSKGQGKKRKANWRKDDVSGYRAQVSPPLPHSHTHYPLICCTSDDDDDDEDDEDDEYTNTFSASCSFYSYTSHFPSSISFSFLHYLTIPLL